MRFGRANKEEPHPLDRKGSVGRLVSGVAFIALVTFFTLYSVLGPKEDPLAPAPGREQVQTPADSAGTEVPADTLRAATQDMR